MEEQKPFEFKPWMWLLLIVALLLLIFNFDPVGGGLQKVFGEGAQRWTINIILIAMIVYYAVFGRKR